MGNPSQGTGFLLPAYEDPDSEHKQIVPYGAGTGSEPMQSTDSMRPKKLSHSAYTVAWVCALDEEMAAAKAMLDDTHGRLPKKHEDHNSYTLGEIGKGNMTHNVVIACLPTYGNSQSASCIKAITMAFPNIKIALMAGIGGSMSPDKVKLGDIVVSYPTDILPGVVQWDLGKHTPNGIFKRTGSLAPPPNTTLTAIKDLRANHLLREGIKFRLYFEEALDKFENRDGWKRPDKTEGKSDKTEDRSKIHYGNIASGNSVIKAKEYRDQMVKDLGGEILCVEMEAAGIMSTFPGLVIRGICDLADENKNDEWHNYAALIAAAYTKELLATTLTPGGIQDEECISKLVFGM